MPFVLFVLQGQRKAFVRSFGSHVFVNAGILVGIKTLAHSERITAFFGKHTLIRLQEDGSFEKVGVPVSFFFCDA